jgi:hypothetical protein
MFGNRDGKRIEPIKRDGQEVKLIENHYQVMPSRECLLAFYHSDVLLYFYSYVLLYFYSYVLPFFYCHTDIITRPHNVL